MLSTPKSRGLLSARKLEALYKFYEYSVTSQSDEAKFMNSDTSLVYSNLDASRKRLGRALLRLIRIFVDEPLRHQRQFRIKYTEDLHLPGLEESLISTANKVLDMATTSDRSLSTVRPLARAFLVTLARLQAHIVTVVELTGKAQPPLQPAAKPRRLRKTISRHLSTPNQLPFFEEAVQDEPFPLESVPPGFTANPTAPHHYPTNAASLMDVHDWLFRSPSCSSLAERDRNSSSKGKSDPPEPPMTLAKALEMTMELLIEIDHDMAIFEFALVTSISKRIRTEAEADALQEVTVLFSETLAWALAVGLVDSRQVSSRDPLLLISLPRLAVFVGCLLLPDSPIGPNRLNSGARPPFMFAESTRDLTYLARQLAVLRADQLWRLAVWTSPFGLSEAETQSVDAATKAAGRFPCATAAKSNAQSLVMQGWNTYGLHLIYKCIARVAGSLSADHPAEFRDILQVAIELHDENLPEAEGQETPSLHPICPLDVHDCLRAGTIRDVRLADLFSWHRVVHSPSTQLSNFSRLYAPKREGEGGKDGKNGPVKLEEGEKEEKHEPVEVGIDVVACLEDEQDYEPPASAPEPSLRSLLLSLFRSAPIENTVPASPPNSLYPLAPWQPDQLPADEPPRLDQSPGGEEDSNERQEEEEEETSAAPRVGRECARCGVRFLALVRRRHHCRRCGHIFCGACCSARAPVAALQPEGEQKSVEMVRVCVDCAEFVRSGLAETLEQIVMSF